MLGIKDLGDNAGVITWESNGNTGVAYAQTSQNGLAWYTKPLWSFLVPTGEESIGNAVINHMLRSVQWGGRALVNDQGGTLAQLNQIGQAGTDYSNALGNANQNEMQAAENAREHQYNLIDQYVRGNNNPDTTYYWDCNGQTIVTHSAQSPGSDCSLEQ